jgi:hypothetical protein
MSFLNIIRDYTEFLNTLSVNFIDGLPLFEFIKQTSFYFLKTIQFVIRYIFTCEWLRDFSLFPITIPQISNSILQENFIFQNSPYLFFNFLELPQFIQNSFLLGLFNSFFLTVPFSIVHIITIRRLFIKGLPSAVFSISGYLCGQIIFISSVIFGLRTFIIAWFSLEPVNYILGIFLIFRLIYNMTQENLRELKTWNNDQYRNFFVTNFILAWCEQTALFQYFGNLNFSPTSSLLETQFHTFSAHSFYIFGICIGCFCFTCIWGFLFLQLKNICIRYTPLFLSNFIQTIHTGSLIVSIAFSLSSIPFYGLDYLTTGPLGFPSQDKIFKNTIFDQFNIKDSVLGLGVSSQFAGVDVDVTPFDRGRYLVFPERTFPYAFEDLNYKGEYEWVTRYDKVSGVSDSRAGFLSLSKLFKKESSVEGKKQPSKGDKNTNIFQIQSNLISETIQPNSEIEPETAESRFEEWYSTESVSSAEEAHPLDTIFLEAQETTFPVDFSRLSANEPGSLDFKIKQKYYSNPIYKSLLSLDIDLFLNRQPKDFKLNPDTEIDLNTKRSMLTAYYDSLRDYAELPYFSEFEDFFDGTKTFSNKVYNQQFKGTLRTVSRLFSLTSDPESNVQQNQLVLKYDQPLYTFSNSPFSAFHEESLELPHTSETQDETTSSSSVFMTHEKTKTPDTFLQETVSGPLYAGWDEKLRKFTITNKFLPRKFTGYKTTLNKSLYTKFSQSNILPETSKFINKPISSPKGEIYKIKFTTWPISQNILNKGSTNSTIPFSVLYVPKSEFGDSQEPLFDSLDILPRNWETRNRRINITLGKTYENVFDYLAPERGGFIWPGNQKIQLKIKPWSS